MNFYEYYKLGGQLDAYHALIDKSNEIKTWVSAVKVSNTKLLQDKLNEFVYSKDGKESSFGKTIMSYAMQGYQERIDKALSGYNLSTVKAIKTDPSTLLNKIKVIQNNHEERHNQTRKIGLDTINKVKREFHAVLQVSSKKVNNSLLEELQKVEESIDEAIRDISSQKILQQYSDGNKVFALPNQGTVRQSINFLLDVQSFLEKDYLTPTEIGDIFEWVLWAFNYAIERGMDYTQEKCLEEVGNEIFDFIKIKGNTTSGYTRGATNKFRLGLSNIELAKETRDQLLEIQNELKKDPTMNFDFDIGNLSLTQKEAVSDKFNNKMDVSLSFPEFSASADKQAFAASSKNWSNSLFGKESRSLGTTSIFRGLARSGGENILEAYIYTLGDEHPERLEVAQHQAMAHIVAKLCLVVDIAMGYSQREGGGAYADTLIINDRAHSKILVFSLSELTEKYIDTLTDIAAMSKMSLEGYDRIGIQQTIYNIRLLIKAKENQGRENFASSKAYSALLYSYLNQLKTDLLLNLTAVDLEI